MIFKLHYALWYGALVGVIPFMFNYAAEYAAATATQQGALYTALPFAALLAKPLVGALADKYQAHKACLLASMLAAMLGYGSLAVYPLVPGLRQRRPLLWQLYCAAALLGNTAMCVANSIGDSLAVSSAQRNGVSYGHYRLWGPVGFGLCGALWGVGSELAPLPKYTAGVLLLVALVALDALLIALWPDQREFRPAAEPAGEPAEQLGLAPTAYGSSGARGPRRPPAAGPGAARLLWRLASEHWSVFGYLLVFTCCGLLTGLHWQFFFRYLEQAASADNRSFALVATLALPVQALGGELLFFLLSARIMRALGASLALVLCLASFSARYLLYAYLVPLVGVYWILPVELLQGPAFGLMYSVLTHQANYYSEKIDELAAEGAGGGLARSLHATLQGALGAAFEGLGLGLGAIVGGRAYDASPVFMWQLAGFGALGLAAACLLAAGLARCRPGALPARRESRARRSPAGSEQAADQDEYVLERLRRIGRYCQSSEPRPSMSEIRATLDELQSRLARAQPDATLRRPQ